MSLANKISIFRLLLAPGVVACLLYYSAGRDELRFVALGLFVVGMATDALDGLIARLKNQQTELGTLLDPIADKSLILSALISCSAIHGLPEWMRIPAWFNLVVISRDVMLVAGAPQFFKQHLIRRQKPCLPVTHQDAQLGLLHCALDLLLNGSLKTLGRCEVTPAGVDEREAFSAPFDGPMQTVTGRPLHRRSHRQAPANQTVEQRGFANIRAPNECRNHHPSTRMPVRR